MLVDAGSATHLTFKEHTFVSHWGEAVTATLDEIRHYVVHVSARQGGLLVAMDAAGVRQRREQQVGIPTDRSQ